MKAIWLSIVMMAAAALGVSGQAVERNYDRFKDLTSITISLGKTPMDSNSNSMSLSLTTEFTGQKVPDDPAAYLSLVVTSREWKLLRADLTLRAIVDDERITVGKFERNYSDVYRGATIEAATMRVPTSTLRKLVEAKNVEFQFMGSETMFSQAELDRMKLFLEAIGK